MYDGSREKAYYASIDERSLPFAVQCASGTLAYIDVPNGEYACFAPAAAAGEHFRWAYLRMPNPSSKPTLANAAAFPAPTSTVNTQVAGLPTVAGTVVCDGAGMAPATATNIRISVRPDYRIVILYSAAGPVDFFMTRVSGE